MSELQALIGAKATDESARVGNALSPDHVKGIVRAQYTSLETSLQSEEWKRLFPGKMILAQFAARASLDSARLKRRYLQLAESASKNPFDPVLAIFEDFSK